MKASFRTIGQFGNLFSPLIICISLFYQLPLFDLAQSRTNTQNCSISTIHLENKISSQTFNLISECENKGYKSEFELFYLYKSMEFLFNFNWPINHYSSIYLV